MIELPKLPYEMDELEPVISQETLEYHYGKHHNAYVTNLNGFIDNDETLQGKNLEEIILASSGGVYNNAAQVWNHTFYWNCLRAPSDGNAPSGELVKMIEASFETVAAFIEIFSKAAVGNFGSGWTWLAKNEDGELEIVSTDDADTLVGTDYTPLMVIDVWEHAYYVDYRNARPSYVENFWKLVNWEFVEGNLK